MCSGRDHDWSDALKRDNSNTEEEQNEPTPSVRISKGCKEEHANPGELHKDAHFLTPHQRINIAVYILMFTVAAFVLDHEYGGLISGWILLRFPRELAIFGYRAG